MEQAQYLDSINELISDRVTVFNNKNSITDRNNLLPDADYPLKDNYWFRISDVICVYVDMRNSTKLNAKDDSSNTASIYDLFSGTAVRIFHNFESSYIDVKGDGVFALFNKNQVFRAFAAAISFKTFASEKFKPLANKKVKDVDVGFHMGIDQKTVIVKQVGIRDDSGRDSRKNEIWAGKTINMAAKLASKSGDNELWVSDRYFESLDDQELIIKSCGCSNGQPSGNKSNLWELPVSLEGDPNFDFAEARVLKSIWCQIHGKEWCEKILELDN